MAYLNLDDTGAKERQYSNRDREAIELVSIALFLHTVSDVILLASHILLWRREDIHAQHGLEACFLQTSQLLVLNFLHNQT